MGQHMNESRKPGFFYGYIIFAACFLFQAIGIGTSVVNTGILRYLLGSVAMHVVREAKCQVLVVK